MKRRCGLGLRVDVLIASAHALRPPGQECGFASHMYILEWGTFDVSQPLVDLVPGPILVIEDDNHSHL